MANSPHAGEYMRMVQTIGESLRFMETLTGCVLADINRVDFFTSHEGLHLLYEQAQTRQVPRHHGMVQPLHPLPLDWRPHPGPRTARTSSIFAASPTPSASRSVPPSPPRRCWPWPGAQSANEPGRLTFIHPFRRRPVETCLPPLVEAIRRNGQQVLWCCDPMHGNTETTARRHQDPPL